MADHTPLRTSMESALARHFHAILDEHMKNGYASGIPNTLLDENVADDIDCLRGLIPTYLFRLNRVRSPLLRLPPELLPMILYATASDTRTHLMDWIQLGHICHDLRDALLGMHALWADVVFDPRYNLVQEELLARAGSCPINISLDHHATPQRVCRAIELLTRARNIDVHRSIDRDQSRSIIEALKQGTNPELEELRLGYDYIDASTAQDITSASTDQPKLIAPKLRAVNFESIFIPVDMSCLRDLSLDWYCMDPTPTQDARTFTDMISSCGLLENLTLHGCIPAYSALKSLCQSEYRISLPHLTYLELRQDMEHIMAFWDVLRIPISTTVYVDYQSAPEEDWACDLKSLLVRTRSLRAFLSRTQRRGVSQISKISVYRSDDEGCCQCILDVKLGTTDSKLPPGIESGSRQTPPSLPWKPWRDYTLGFSTCTLVQDPDEIVSFLKCLCTVLQVHVDNIDTVEYTWTNNSLALDERNHDPCILYAVFPTTTALCLNIDPLCVDVGCILSPLSPQGFDCLPKLHALHLDQTFSQAGVERLIDALNMRADYGRPVHVLTLRHKFLESDPETGMEDEEGEEEEEEEDAIERRLLLVRRLQDIVPHVRFDEFQ